MKYEYVLFILLLLPISGKAQSNVTGLGHYIIGVTTPDSLKSIDLKEQDESYVKGTLTLTCSHIRTFSSLGTEVGGIRVANLVLSFYDNTLFRIACTYSDTLKPIFRIQQGSGTPKPTAVFHLCTKETDKPVLMWGEAWQSGDISALVVHRKGYTADCKPEEGASLIIASQKLSALSSECELQGSDPLIEEYIDSLND